MTVTVPAVARRRSGRGLLEAVVCTRSAPAAVDWAMLAARIALAWIFIYYGAGKLFGAFNGPGIHVTALYFSETAHLHPGGLFAVLGGVIEFGGGVALALGFLSRLAGIALFGDMVMAMITVTWATGISSQSPPPGYQLNMALGVLALVVALLGSGRFSMDALMERHVAGTSSSPGTDALPVHGGTARRLRSRPSRAGSASNPRPGQDSNLRSTD